jgi:hypothetical protein
MEYPAQETTQQQSINIFAAAHHIHFNPLSTLSATASLLTQLFPGVGKIMPTLRQYASFIQSAYRKARTNNYCA